MVQMVPRALISAALDSEGGAGEAGNHGKRHGPHLRRVDGCPDEKPSAAARVMIITEAIVFPVPTPKRPSMKRVPTSSTTWHERIRTCGLWTAYVARVDDFPQIATLVCLESTLFWRKRALWASSRLCQRPKCVDSRHTSTREGPKSSTRRC